MIDRHYRKPHRYKKKKPILSKKFLAFSFLILIVVCAIFYGLFLWKILWVEKIIINGEEKIAKEEIDSLISKRLENNILFFQTKSILAVDGGQIRDDILNTFPGIGEVRVSKRFFDTINIQITERAPSALWCESERCFFLDEEGIIFEEASADSELIVIEDDNSAGELFLGKVIIKKDVLAQIMKIKSKLAETKISIIEASIISEERLDVKTEEGWEIYFNPKGNLDWQATELGLALEKQISPEKRKNLQYIDLRFRSLYYK